MATTFTLWGTAFVLVKYLAQNVMVLLLNMKMDRKDKTGLQGHSQAWEDSPFTLAGLFEQIQFCCNAKA